MPLRTRPMPRLQSAPPLLALCIVLTGSGCDADHPAGATDAPAGSEAALAAALLAEFPDYDICPAPDDLGALRYLAGRIDLNCDGQPEVVALALGRDACGSGGCTAFVLAEQDDRYRVVSAISTASAPILAATGRTQGWRDLIVEVAGGGAKAGGRLLRFDGKGYPDNASLAPPAAAAGKVIIAGDGVEAIAAAPLLVPVGCAEGPAGVGASMIASEALGSLRIGSAAAEVKGLLGQPAQRGEPQLWGADGLYHRDWSFPARGVVVGLSAPEPGGPWQVDSLTLSPPATLTTVRGIGLGATEAQVRAAYPNAAAAPPAEGLSSALRIGSAYDALIFGFNKHGRVERVDLGAPAE